MQLKNIVKCHDWFHNKVRVIEGKQKAPANQKLPTTSSRLSTPQSFYNPRKTNKENKSEEKQDHMRNSLSTQFLAYKYKFN